MRLRRIAGDGGSVAIFVFMAIPLLTAMLLLIVDVGRIAVARARLQAAADRAAYAAASSLAYSLNSVAASNWELQTAYRNLRGDFEGNSYDGEDAARDRIGEYEAARDRSLAEMELALGEMEGRAVRTAESVLFDNSPVADLDLVLNAEALLYENKDSLTYDYVSGFGLSEPERTGDGEYEALSHLAKDSAPDASVGIFAAAEVSPLLLGVLNRDPVEVHAASAAQAYGGSLEDFALKDSDSLEEAEALVDDDGYDGLYRSSIVPVWTVGVDESAIYH